MTRSQFSPDEWKSLLNAPRWVYAAMVAAEAGAISTRRVEEKALENLLTSYASQSPLVKEIIAGQKEADDKLSGSVEDAEKKLGQVSALLERRVSEDEGNAVRGLLMAVGKAVAQATREALFGGVESAAEKKTLARVEVALQATQADKDRRREATAAAVAKPAVGSAGPLAGVAAAAQPAAATPKPALTPTPKPTIRPEATPTPKPTIRPEATPTPKPTIRPEATPAPTGTPAQTAAAAGTVTTYVVKKGDTLSGIAKQIYGKASRWPEIYEANKDLIKDPNLIQIGWKLRIP